MPDLSTVHVTELDSLVSFYHLTGGLTGDPYQRLAVRISEMIGQRVFGWEVAAEHARRRKDQT